MYFKILLILNLLFSSLLLSDDEYELGNGKQIGELPLYLGGYFSLGYKNRLNENEYQLDDIALLAYGSYDKFTYLSELEFREFYTQTYIGDKSSVDKDQQVYIERLYCDYNIDDNYILRAGKYNTNIGFWNLLPINVLRETTSNPHTSSLLFPKFTTGLDISYMSYGEGELKINANLQDNRDIDSDYNNDQIEQNYGFGVSYSQDNYSLKLNGGYFKTDKGEYDNLYYGLLSLKIDDENYQILSEVGTQRTDKSPTTEYAAYIQGLYRITQKHIAVARVESYNEKIENKKDSILIAGYNYRPLYPIAFKSEYQFHSLDKENQFLFSFSVLF